MKCYLDNFFKAELIFKGKGVAKYGKIKKAIHYMQKFGDKYEKGNYYFSLKNQDILKTKIQQF